MSLLAAVGLGCTPVEVPSQGLAEDPSEPEFVAAAPEPVRPAICGALTFEPTGPWQSKGERLEHVRDAWHPRAEYGQPIAIRAATPPFVWKDYDFFQIEVVGAPYPVEPCYLPQTRPEDYTEAFECAPAWRLVDQAPREAWPANPEQWAALMGTLDHATAVFTSPEALRGCMPELPAAVEAGLPALGRGTEDEAQTWTFVERLDPDPRTTLLLAVQVSIEEQNITTEHQHLWLFDHPEAS